MKPKTNPRGSDHTAVELIELAVGKWRRKGGTDDWMRRHVRAWDASQGPGGAITGMIMTWADYADAHHEHFGTSIGDDGYLGPLWLSIGGTINNMLSGEIGQLDGGSLHDLLRIVADHEGLNLDDA